jgi:predicted phosphodiesterase
MSDIVFYCESDLHFNPTIRIDKESNENKIAPNSLVLIAGDLTNNGSDGKKLLGFIPISGSVKQLQGLQAYIKRLENYKCRVLCCMGNHDDYTYFPYIYKATESFIKKRHGKLHYTIEHEGIRYICLSKCPTESRLPYLKNELAKNSTIPTVIFFHYNLQGAWSHWWKDSEKEEFYQVIKNYENIILIATGHIHKTDIYDWRGFKVVTCGGSELIKCSFTKSSNKLFIEKI